MIEAHFHRGPWSGQNRWVEAHQVHLLVHKGRRRGDYMLDPEWPSEDDERVHYRWLGWS